MNLTVTNWEKHQERGDRANYVWFKFHNSYWRDEKVFKMNTRGKVLFIYILSVCSENNSATIEFIPELAATMLGFKPTDNEINALHVCGLISGNFQENVVLERKKERKKEVFDLELIYQQYPKRPGTNKKQGTERLARKVKTLEDFERLMKATVNYARHCLAEKTEPKYIKQFSTFTNCWEEWVEPVSSPASSDVAKWEEIRK